MKSPGHEMILASTGSGKTFALTFTRKDHGAAASVAWSESAQTD